MKLRGLKATIGAQIEQFVREVENHEAVAKAGLKDFRSQIHEQKIKAKMLEKEISRIQSKVNDLEEAARRWKLRAIEYGESDKAKAIECAKRFKAASDEIEFWKKSEQQLSESLDSQKSTLNHNERLYQKMKMEVLRYSQQSVKSKASSGAPCEEFQDLFERWEERILRDQARCELSEDLVDQFERELDEQEEEAAAEDLLSQFLKEEKE